MRSRRARAVAVGATVGLLVAVPLPAMAHAPTAPAADPAPLFASSFEPTDPQPAWTNTVETDSAGNKKASGIDGTSKWLTFTSTGWVRYQLSTPVAVVDYALTSANDAPERDPRDWTLSGSA